jgi:hypothetical protein
VKVVCHPIGVRVPKVQIVPNVLVRAAVPATIADLAAAVEEVVVLEAAVLVVAVDAIAIAARVPTPHRAPKIARADAGAVPPATTRCSRATSRSSSTPRCRNRVLSRKRP